MNKIITIEREFCSGGNEIGRMVSKATGYPMYDRNILVEAAKRLEIPHRYIEDLEETSPGSVIFNLSNTILGGHNTKKLPLAEQLFMEEKTIMETLAEKSSCIIVGRCGSEIFKSHPQSLRIFIYASKDFRVNRALQIEHIPEKELKEKISKVDRRRSSYYTAHTALEWGEPHNFDLCLDSSKLGLEECAKLIVHLSQSPL